MKPKGVEAGRGRDIKEGKEREAELTSARKHSDGCGDMGIGLPGTGIGLPGSPPQPSMAGDRPRGAIGEVGQSQSHRAQKHGGIMKPTGGTSWRRGVRTCAQIRRRSLSGATHGAIDSLSYSTTSTV